jgi:undecaprenyl pyrophosphate phosphatase UppP
MKGINPLYFKLINSTTILLILVPSMLHTVDFKTAISVAILLGAIILIVIYYNWKKISKINKGKIIKSVKGKIGNWGLSNVSVGE